jgi:hypothetical protein
MSINSFFVLTVPNTEIGFITSQFIQGARLAGANVYSNVESLHSDGRFCKAELINYGVIYKQYPDLSDTIIIDERRFLSSQSDIGEMITTRYSQFADNHSCALIYANDDVNYISFPQNLKCFLPHKLRHFDKNPHSHPVPWGVTCEGFNCARNSSRRTRLRNSILFNFNPTALQGVREAIISAVEPKMMGMFQIDRRNSYGQGLVEQLTTLEYAFAFGGNFHWPKSDYPWNRDRMSPEQKSLDEFPNRTSTVGIVRWDSFRFWETMAFGCLPIQLDFDLYGFQLPVNPRKWLDYIPVDLSNIENTLSTMLTISEDQEGMIHRSIEASEWALRNVHPSVVYDYIVNRISQSQQV